MKIFVFYTQEVGRDGKKRGTYGPCFTILEDDLESAKASLIESQMYKDYIEEYKNSYDKSHVGVENMGVEEYEKSVVINTYCD